MFVYDKATGLSGGLKKILAHITLRRDEGERFYCYGYSKEKKTPYYIALWHPLPNIFHCTAFKKRHGFILDENEKKADFSQLFLYVPSTLDRILQWKITFTCIQSMWTMKNWKKIHNDGDMNPACLEHKE